MPRPANRQYSPKNTALWGAIRRKGYKTVSSLCRTETAYKLHNTRVGKLINCQESPLKNDGRYKTLCLALQEVLDTDVEDLFPLKLYTEVLPPGIKTVCPFTDLPADMRREITQLADDKGEDPVVGAAQAILKSKIEHVLKILSYREREIIKLRHGLGDGYSFTIEEVGNIFKVTREKIAQIEAKAVSAAQQRSRSQELVDFLD